ncbi:MAG TPA: hypothetical protein VIN11_00505, partial [Roseivirga sp.]
MRFSWFIASLGLTLLFFVYKGVLYAALGSFTPLCFIGVFLLLFLYGFKKSIKLFKNSLLAWAILMMLWSGVRLLLSLVNLFVKPIPEAHVSDQLGFLGILLSLLFLIAGVLIKRYSTRFTGDWSPLTDNPSNNSKIINHA